MIKYYDCPISLPLIYPRAILTVNGGKDGNTPIDGLYNCLDLVTHLYKDSNQSTSDKFHSYV